MFLLLSDGTSQEIQSQIDEKNLAEFNNNFLKYQGNTKCTIHDIVSLANFAKKYNIDFNKQDVDYINVYLGRNNNIDLTQKDDNYYFNTLLPNSIKSNGDVKYYKCTEIKYNDITKKVNLIRFEQN